MSLIAVIFLHVMANSGRLGGGWRAPARRNVARRRRLVSPQPEDGARHDEPCGSE
jgi:hypothetical protein